MSADEAVDHVMATLPDPTFEQLKKDVAATQTKQKFAWQPALASRYPDAADVSDPTYVKGRLSAKSVPTSTGSEYLSVSLEVYIRKQVSIDGERSTVVVKRGLLMNSYRPQAISDETWPAVGFNYDFYGADYCQVLRNAIIAPATDASTLEHSVKNLRKDLASKAVEGSGTMGAKDYAFIKKQMSKC